MNRDLTALRNIKLFVLDMDGTFYLGENLIEGSLEFIEKLRNTGRRFLFFTNNSSKVSAFYRDKLSRLGCDVGEEDIVTSGDVTISFLKASRPSKKVYLVGTRLLEQSFLDAGIQLVEDKPDVVVIGFDTSLDYDKISKACKYIREGAEFIATHPDLNCPVEDGFIPDCGAICAMITASTGISPKYLGKPFKETINAVLDITGLHKSEIAFVGDRLYTDIAIGARNGVTSILVLSGETKLEDVETSDVKPDYIFSSIGELKEVL